MTVEARLSAGIEAWFVAHEADLALASREDREVASEQLASLESLLRTVGAGADYSMPKAYRQGSWPNDVDAATAALVGRAVGASFARAPSRRKLEAADAMVWSSAGWDAFSDAAAGELGADPARPAAVEACLDELVQAFTWAPRRAAETLRDNTCALVERFHEQPRLDDVWSSGHNAVMFVRHEPAFDALRLADPSAFLRLLDRFPHPEPGRHVVAYSSRRMDLAGLLELLRLAPPCFEDGAWLPWIKAPFLVLASIGETLAAIPDEEWDRGSVPSEAPVSSAAKVIGTLVARTDGNELGHAWLQRLMRVHALRGVRTPDNDRTRLRHQLILVELASALSPRRGAARWVEAEQDVWRRDRAVAVLAAAGLGGAGSRTTAEGLMLDLLWLGLWTTGLDASFSAPSTPERCLVAALIGRYPDPAAWFDALWHSMAPLRDRARHAQVSAGGHAGDATVIAVTWFLFGLDTVDPRTPAHRALWRSLLRAVRECSLAQSSPLAQPSWRARYQFLAAHLASSLAADADGEAADDLRELLGPLQCLDMTLAEVLAVLFDAGVTAIAIAGAVDRPARLAALLRRLLMEQSWREDMQQERLGRQSRFSLKIARMADVVEGAARYAP